jgi:uncharacterized protein YjbI with pentapeptide repeats
MADDYKDPEHAIPYLKLIKLGVPTWNKWIRGELIEAEAIDLAAKLAPTPVPERPRVVMGGVNFSGVDFRKGNNNTISFENAMLGPRANFQGAVFGAVTGFMNAEFGAGANFSDAVFHNSVDFSVATFCDNADFSGATFSNGVTFSRATFCNNANFSSAQFGGVADFSAAVFDNVYFGKSSFLHAVWFKESKFGSMAVFVGATFLHSDFRECTFSKFAIFTNATFLEPPEFDDWKGAEKADWIGAKFKIRGPRPRFHWLWKRNEDVDGWCGMTVNYPTRLRRLRKVMEDANAHDVARDLFILERKAERGIMIESNPKSWAPLGPIVLLWLFESLSDCGRSAKRPFVLFMLMLAFFFAFYGLMKDAGQFFRAYDIPDGWPGAFLADIFSFTIGHAMPLASMSKAQEDVMVRLFGDSCRGLIDLPFWIGFFSIIQSLIGALLLFLCLQAVRNHFRLR